MKMVSSVRAAALVVLASSMLAGCGTKSGSPANNAAQNARVNTVDRLHTSTVNQVGLPGLTHGATLRSDRNLEARVNAIPGIGTTSVLTTGNTAYVLLDAGYRTGKGNTGPGTAGTQNTGGGRVLSQDGTIYSGTPSTGIAHNGTTGAGSTDNYGGTTGHTGNGTRDLGVGRDGRAGATGMGTNTNANNLPQVGISSTSNSPNTELQQRITSTIRTANPSIQNIYFVTKVQ